MLREAVVPVKVGSVCEAAPAMRPYLVTLKGLLEEGDGPYPHVVYAYSREDAWEVAITLIQMDGWTQDTLVSEIRELGEGEFLAFLRR